MSGRHIRRCLTLQTKLVTLLGAVDLQRFGHCSKCSDILFTMILIYMSI